METHSSTLAWKIPWTEEPGGPWGCRETQMSDWVYAHVRAHTHTYTHTSPKESTLKSTGNSSNFRTCRGGIRNAHFKHIPYVILRNVFHEPHIKKHSLSHFTDGEIKACRGKEQRLKITRVRSWAGLLAYPGLLSTKFRLPTDCLPGLLTFQGNL